MRRRADLVLVERGFFDSRARAQAAIAAGLVTAAGAPVRKPSDAIPADADIAAEAPHHYVSRGGVKLAHALDHFAIPVAGRDALDVGASTGGFTDVLLRRGAGSVVAVDTGREQFHPSLRGDPRVRLMEATDIRRLAPADLPSRPGLVVVDVSFISLGLVLGPALALADAPADLVALVKPQFEVGRALVGRGGIVRDEAARATAVERICDLVGSLGWRVLGTTPSPIAGGDGNREVLVAARRGA